MPTVLAIDPGRHKCGVAVVEKTPAAPKPTLDVLHREVVLLAELGDLVAELASRFELDIVVLGDGTNSAEIAGTIESRCPLPVMIVDEKYSTLHARKRFFEENPPRGLRRLIPVSLQTPNRPYDDYVAVILAERYLSAL